MTRMVALKAEEKPVDRADYVFAFLLPVDMVEWVGHRGGVLSIGRGKRVDITEAFYHGPVADGFHDNGLNHSVFESEEEVRMYLEIDEHVNAHSYAGRYIDVTSSDSEAVATSGAGLVRVYHYTNRAGYEGILKSGHIRPSDIMQADASYGSSVYATELDPSTPFWTILQNNYEMDGGIQGRGESRKDRADYVFAFLEYNSSLKFIDNEDNEGRRSVLCIGGGDKVKVAGALYSGKAAVAADVLKNRRKKALVYHYTNQEGYKRILERGYISPESMTVSDGSDFQVSGVRGTFLDPSKPICTILHKMYGEGGRLYGRGENMLDRADYVFAFLLPVDMVEWVGHRGGVLSIGRGKRVDITEAFYHGPVADGFHDNGLNHSGFESEEEVRMYLEIDEHVNAHSYAGRYIDVTSSDSEAVATSGAGLVRVYHYTNRAGYEGILKSGHIRPSDIMQADASYGSSVYATELDPSTPFWTILQNNYDMDGGIQSRGESRKDRADYVFAFDMPNSSLKFIDNEDNEGRRSVLCIGGGDKVAVDDAFYSGKAAVAANVLKNRRKKVLVYHYTNQEGYESILENGYISPEIIRGTWTPWDPDWHISSYRISRREKHGVPGTLPDPSKPIYTILHNMYGEGGRLYGRGKNMLDRADYVFAFLLPVDMVEWVGHRGGVLCIGGGKRVDISEAFYHGPAADAFDDNGLNHSVIESEEVVRMYLQIEEAVNRQTQSDNINVSD